VVEVSRTDFEENGVSGDVLQLLQEVSHKKNFYVQWFVMFELRADIWTL